MNNKPDDDDLEEGEIADDVPTISQIELEEKKKVLPRRYILHEKKNGVHCKHKRRCKHSVTKKSVKTKNTSVRLKKASKRHHKSCPRHVDRLPDHFSRAIRTVRKKQLFNHFDENNQTGFHNHSLYAEIKSSYQNYSKFPQEISKHNKFQKLPDDPPDTNSRYPKLANCMQLPFVNKNIERTVDSVTDISENEHLSKKIDDATNFNTNGEVGHEARPNMSETLLSESVTTLCEESEDEEELRRIALATCIKRNKVIEKCNDENVNSNISCSNVIADSVLPPLESCEGKPCNGIVASCEQTSDNYEIVDMEVDDENLSSKENIDDEELFIIDTRPSFDEEFHNSDHNNPFPHVEGKGQTSSHLDDEFEEQLLRAELIANMSRLRKPESSVIDSNVTTNNQASKSKFVSKYSKKRLCIRSDKSLKMPNVIKRQENIQVNEPNELNDILVKRQERIVIRVTEDSTSDDDEEEGSTRQIVVQDNAVASLEALISDARHKSDEGNVTNSDGDNVSKAVACLSKAQQEEYSTLKKLLAEKEKVFPIQTELMPCKKTVNNSSEDNLNLLEKKLLIARANLAKENKLISGMSKEYLANKSNFLKAKLSVQLLREQLVAAERVKKSHIECLAKCNRQLQTLKKSVAKRQILINELQNDCTRLGLRVRGQDYVLPSLPSNGIFNKTEPSS